MGRRLKNGVPICPKKLIVPLSKEVVKKEEELKEKQRNAYNKRHGVKELSELKIGDYVWVMDIRKYGEIMKTDDYPRSYVIKCGTKYYRRNRSFLIASNKLQNLEQEESGLDIDFIIGNNIQNSESATINMENSIQSNISSDNNPLEVQNVVNPSPTMLNQSDNEQLQDSNPTNDNCPSSSTNDELNESRSIQGRPTRERKKPNWFGF